MTPPFETMTEKELKTVRRAYLWKLLPPAILFLCLVLVILIYTGLNRSSGLTTLLLTVSAFIAGSIVFFFTTRYHRLDLQLRKVSVEKAVVEDKNYKLDYEPGSASVPVNLLSFLFIKKIASREMKELHIYSITAGGEEYFLDKISYDKLETGSTILIRRAENTKLFLGIETIKKRPPRCLILILHAGIFHLLWLSPLPPINNPFRYNPVCIPCSRLLSDVCRLNTIKFTPPLVASAQGLAKHNLC